MNKNLKNSHDYTNFLLFHENNDDKKDSPEVEDDKELSKDGPLPWCQSNDLVYVAEQVSHHPPISAFYCEHVKKRIAVNAHIYTKSSFLGMSVSDLFCT